MEKFQNKYRIPSARAQWWDYRWAGAYFITICTAHRKHYFGEIKNRSMDLSPIGIIADILWHEIPNHSPNAKLGAFVVMPNHIHGILVVTDRAGDNDMINDDDNDNDNDTNNVVETGHALSLQTQQTEQTIGQKRFQNIGKNSVSSIVGSYKSAVSKHAHRLGHQFQWQTRFHDHIIRDDAEYQCIHHYILNNPANWPGDHFFKSTM